MQAVVLRVATVLLALHLGGCNYSERRTLDDVVDGNNVSALPESVEQQALSVLEPLEPPAPGTPGGLPVAAAPVSEGSIDPASAEGAAQLVRGYYGLLEEGRFADAQDIWKDGPRHGDEDPAAFAARFAMASEIHANVGVPGEPEGAAGSLYVTVPVQIYARVKASGKPYYALRAVVLRRINDVPGSSAQVRRWHIERIGAWPKPDQTPKAQV